MFVVRAGVVCCCETSLFMLVIVLLVYALYGLCLYFSCFSCWLVLYLFV